MARRTLCRRALLWRTVICLFALLFTGACDAMKSKPKPLRLGLSDWPGHAPFYGAAKLGNFGPTQVEIKGFSSNFDRSRAFAQGHLDVLCTPLFDALRIADDGVAFKVILLFDYSSGGDGIVARQAIADIAALRGKRVGAEASSITHFVLLAALQQGGLTEADVELVNLSAPEQVAAFARSKLDAATLWDPHLSRLADVNGAHKIFTSKEIPGQILDVVIVHKAIAEERPEDVASIVRGWEQTLSAWRARPEEMEAIMAKETNWSPEGLRADFAGMELLDSARNRELFDLNTPGQSVWRTYEATVRFMVQHQLLKRAAPEAKDILDPRFVEQARAK